MEDYLKALITIFVLMSGYVVLTYEFVKTIQPPKFDKFNGIIYDITSDGNPCEICFEYNTNGIDCISTQEDLCYDNYVYAKNDFSTCYINEKVSGKKIETIYLQNTYINKSVSWYYDNKKLSTCKIDNNYKKEDHSLFKLMFVLATIFTFFITAGICGYLEEEYYKYLHSKRCQQKYIAELENRKKYLNNNNRIQPEISISNIHIAVS